MAHSSGVQVVLMSYILVLMTLYCVTEPVILRPQWYPYFRDGDATGSQQATDDAARGMSWPEQEAMTQEDIERHLELQREADRHSDASLRQAVAAARAANCTTSGAHNCYYRYTSLLLRMLQRNFYDAVST